MADDLTTLPELDEEKLVDQLKQRYNQNKIYTYIGDILIATNPYCDLPIYGHEKRLEYSNVKSQADLEPHIYIVSDRAYNRLRLESKNQCCVVSGESGAGKTESTKLLIEHIAQLCKHDDSNLHEKIVAVNPLLEAFGNAQTSINNNSSRFGKFIELKFDKSGAIKGAKIIEYLLEKSRVVNHGKEDKNFHIFYYLFAGLQDDQLKANLLSSPDQHRIMLEDGGKVYTNEGKKNECKKEWLKLKDVLKRVGFTSDEENGIKAVLSAILHICDIRFIPQTDTEGVAIDNDQIISLISQLLSVDAEKLIESLIVSRNKVNNEIITSLKNESQASDSRDALAKALYGRMFSWIVVQINKLLSPKNDSSDDDPWIGILDIYGFENFVLNSFEQLCINIANEQLHSFFNEFIFKLELDEYAKEGIDCNKVVYIDNQPVIDLFLSSSPPGIFALLDEESKFPQSNDQSLIDKLNKNLSNSPYYSTSKGQSFNFTIKHFAGQVTYNVEKFLEKNRDTLSDNVVDCMKGSDCLLVNELFNPKSLEYYRTLSRGNVTSRRPALRMSRMLEPGNKVEKKTIVNTKEFSNRMSKMYGAKNNSVLKNSTIKSDTLRVAKTLASNFKGSLIGLIEKMILAQPHFIRCIKPNNNKEAKNFKDKIVFQQLNYTGVLETIKIRKMGYSVRLPFPLFVERYGLIVGILNSKGKGGGNEIGISKQIVSKANLSDYQIGKTKVFLRHYHIEILFKKMQESSELIIKCQSFWRSSVAKRQLDNLKKQKIIYKNQFDELIKIMIKNGENFKLNMDLDKKKDENDEKERKIKSEKEKMEEQEALQTINDATNSPANNSKSFSYPITDGTETIVERNKKSNKISLNDFNPMPPIDESNIREPKLPPSFNGVSEDVYSDPVYVFLQESLPKINTLPTEIWGKFYFLEKNAIIGKLYVRDLKIKIDDSKISYTGTEVGINSETFEHVKENEIKKVLKNFGKGVDIYRDLDGNLYVQRNGKCLVHVHGVSNRHVNCFPDTLNNRNSKIEDVIQIFDINVFKDKVAKQLREGKRSGPAIARLCIISLSFDKTSINEVDLPLWISILNIHALDLLGNQNFYNEMINKKLIPGNDQELKDFWDNLNFDRKKANF